MGHEAAGIIERVGPDVSGLSVGERVTWDSTVSCGGCAYCRQGNVNLCDARMVLGVSCREYRRDGAFAEYVAVPARIIYKLPDTLPFEHAALIEALSVVVHAIRRSGTTLVPSVPATFSEKVPATSPQKVPATFSQKVPGTFPGKVPATTLVVGCGTIGLLTIQALRAYGCTTIFASEIDEQRRALATRVGATRVFDPGTVDLIAEVRKLTGGAGADQAFEAVGKRETVAAAIAGVRKGGTVTLIGNLTPAVDLPLQDVVTRELSLLGTCASAGEYPECIELMASGAVDVRPLISVTAPLDDGPQWFDRLHRGEGGLMKVILRP